MKKAQTEMLGIAIVVILISIGILFIVSNALRSSGETTSKREFSEQQLATNILASMLSTTSTCQNDKISTLLIDCGNCWDSPSTCRTCGGDFMGITILPNTIICTYLDIAVDAMLNGTLKSWNKKYQFLAYTNPDEPIIEINDSIEECLTGGGTGLRYIQKDSYYLPLYPGTMTVELGLCS